MSIGRRFFELEQGYSLFDIEIDNVRIWERLRFGLFREIEQKAGGEKAHTSIDLDTTDYFMGAKLWVSNLFFRNPYLGRESEFLFVGHPRRKKQSDGYWWDIYCDPIHEQSSLDSVHFEEPYLLDHRTPAKTEPLRYLEFIVYSGTIQRKLGLYDVSFSDEEKACLDRVENEINKYFHVEINLKRKIKHLLRNRRSRLWLYKLLIDKINPNIAVIVVSYGKETFIEACKEKGVPTVELQHGIIHPGHFGYSFPGDRDKVLFPDYLLTWGEFWGRDTEIPIPNNRIMPVGFPYLEWTKRQYEESQSKKQIVFISQGTIGSELSKFALEVNRHPDIDHNIVYKLHPGEYDRWQYEYPWMADVDIEIIDSSQPSLYQLFAESTIQVGVSSTAVYEGLAFGLETYIYDCQSSDVLSPLIANEVARLVTSSDEIAAIIGRDSASFNKDYYFASNALEQVTSTLNRLADEGTQYCSGRK